nr:protein kinase-like domain, concanavalin A-like lectin/glucanase domain protein [Tanacetum cinerariifolium]
MDPQCLTHVHGSINAVTIHSVKQSDSYDEKEKENEEEEKDSPKIYVSTLLRRSIHQLHLSPKKSSNSIHSSNRSGEPEEEESTTTEGVGAKYFDMFSTRSELTYHKRKLDPRENTNRGVSNLIERIKGMHVFIGNFTYVIDFMIVEDISSIIDLRLSQVVLGRPFVEISNMTHDPPEGVVRNEEDKSRGVEYVMRKIFGFYKECLELGPEYLTVMDDEGEVT